MATHKTHKAKTLKVIDTRETDYLLVLTRIKRGKDHSDVASYHPSIAAAKLAATKHIGQYRYAIYNINEPSQTIIGLTYNKGIDAKLSKKPKKRIHHSIGDDDGTNPREIHNYKGSLPLHHVCTRECLYDSDGNVRNCRNTGVIRQGNKIIKRPRKVDFSNKGEYAFTSDILKRDKRSRVQVGIRSIEHKPYTLNVEFQDGTQGTFETEQYQEIKVVRKVTYESKAPNHVLAKELASHQLQLARAHERGSAIKRLNTPMVPMAIGQAEYMRLKAIAWRIAVSHDSRLAR